MKQDNKEKYLKEDEDLITKLENIGVLSTGAPLEEQKRTLQEIQIKATLRHRKSFDDSEKSNSKISNTLIIFAIIQILIAFLQFMLSTLDSSYKWVGILFSFCILFFIYKFLRV